MSRHSSSLGNARQSKRVSQRGSTRLGDGGDKGRADGRRGGAAFGKAFPKRPLVCRLSQKTWSKLEQLFKAMDADGSNAVTKEEADEFFKGAVKKNSTDAMFNEVDVDGSGAIAADEFMAFWVQVRSAGYSDGDIHDEIEQLLEGGAWVDWKDGRDTSASAVRFPKRPLFCRLSNKVWKKCEELFRKMDKDDSLAITREKAENFFTGTFVGISVDAMFNEVDLDNHGTITAEQWMKFWVQVKASGYKERDIIDEIDLMLEGGSWVDWKDGRSTA